MIKVNGVQIHSLVKEEVDYDPTKTETLLVDPFKVNDKLVLEGNTPWIIDEMEDRIQTTLGMDQLNSIEITGIKCKSWVANELLDLLTCFDIPDHGLDKLKLRAFDPQCGPFEEEVVARLANMCPNITHLNLSCMAYQSEASRLQIVTLFRLIIQQKPQLELLDMGTFSDKHDRDQNFAEIILETLLSSNIDSITNIRLFNNESWFKNPVTKEDRFSNVELLGELFSKQTGLEHIGLGNNQFSNIAFQTILASIAGHPSTSTTLQTLGLSQTNWEADETVEMLADILQLASNLKKCDIRGGHRQQNRFINVQIEYARIQSTGAYQAGSIVIRGSRVICTRETNRTEENQIEIT